MEPRKPDLFAGAHEAPAREIIELSDARDPAWRMTIEIQQATVITDYEAEELCAEMCARYLTGNPAIGLEPQPFLVGGKAVHTTPAFWEDVAYICALQPKPSALPFDYTPEEIAQLAFRRRAAWRQLGARVRELHSAGAAPLPNAPGAPENG